MNIKSSCGAVCSSSVKVIPLIAVVKIISHSTLTNHQSIVFDTGIISFLDYETWIAEVAVQRLGKCNVHVIGNMGYFPQSHEEMDVPFKILAGCYEHGTFMSTGDLPFSKWEKIL